VPDHDLEEARRCYRKRQWARAYNWFIWLLLFLIIIAVNIYACK